MENNFYLPFTNQETIDLIFIIKEKINQYSNYLNYSNVNIAGVYGCFPNIIWNGGRTLLDNEFDNIEKIQSCIKNFNDNGLICKFTFTNSLLTDEHLKDEYCNELLDLISQSKNEITIYSSILEDYILNKYPNIPLNSSITKGTDFETFKREMDKNIYKRIVCYPRRNILSYIEQLKPEDKNKVELLISSGCGYCKIYKEHYKIESFNSLYNKKEKFNCYRLNNNYNFAEEHSNQPFEEQMIFDIDYYQNIGISSYKVQGRVCHEIDLSISQYCNLFFQENIKNEVIEEIKPLFNIT